MALLNALSEAGLTQAQLAEKSGITQGAISQLIGRGYRAAPTTLKRLTGCWKSEKTATAILAAHLLDEVQRAGLDPERYAIREGNRLVPTLSTPLDRNLDYLRKASRWVPVLETLIQDLADLTEETVTRRMPEPANRVAESHAPFFVNPKKPSG